VYFYYKTGAANLNRIEFYLESQPADLIPGVATYGNPYKLQPYAGASLPTGTTSTSTFITLCYKKSVTTIISPVTNVYNDGSSSIPNYEYFNNTPSTTLVCGYKELNK